MHIDLFVLCDAATDWMGKLNILGTFDTIQAAEVPAMHPHCTVAGRVRFQRIERGVHPMRITVVDSDGQPVVNPFEGELRANFPDALSSHAINFVITLQRLRFEKFGEYSIDLSIDGRQEASLPLTIRERPAPQAPPPPPDEPFERRRRS